MAGALLANLTLSTDANDLGIGSSGSVIPISDQHRPRVFASLQVSNPTATAIQVTGIAPYVYISSATGGQAPAAVSIGTPVFGLAKSASIPAAASGNNGNVYYNYEIIPRGPLPGGQTGPLGNPNTTGTAIASIANPATQVLTAGVWVQGSDSSYVQATGVALSQVLPVAQGGMFHFACNLITATAPKWGNQT